jgi:L-histidine N-alpha-methyltransferase
VVNRELGADFDPDASSTSPVRRRREWIEMRLRALRTATVTIPALGLEVSFAAGEEVRTEISAKFTRERLEATTRPPDCA